MKAISSSRASDSFACRTCGFSAPKWFGRCPDCGEWSTAAASIQDGGEAAEVHSLSRAAAAERWPTGIRELDRVLGGGLVPGSAVLLGGEPGIGKSTLILQIIEGLLATQRSALLVSGEESLDQISLRAARLGLSLDRVRVACSTSLPSVLGAARREAPDLLVVDSIQTLDGPAVNGSPGSVSQVRACATDLIRNAKESGAAVIMVGHVTKDGSVAGPKALEHAVDVLLNLEGERTGILRFLRTPKNRFGSCDETGVFTMSGAGLEEIADPSAMLLEDRRLDVPGSVVFPALEGTRPLCVEVQALVSGSDYAQARRVGIGLDARRLALVLGVIEQSVGIEFDKQDVFVAAAGGIPIREPAADLAVALAVLSAYLRSPIAHGVVAVGEVGLAGEVRRVPALERRLSEATRLGFDRAIAPASAGRFDSGIRIDPVRDLHEALQRVELPRGRE